MATIHASGLLFYFFFAEAAITTAVVAITAGFGLLSFFSSVVMDVVLHLAAIQAVD